MHAFLSRIDRFFPVRYFAWAVTIVLTGWFALRWWQTGDGAIFALVAAVFMLRGLGDSLQCQRSVLRNYPLIGHIRFLLELIRPEIRQYFLESDNEETPFSRQQRSIVYQRAKGDVDKKPFGTQIDQKAAGYEWINHSLMPTEIPDPDFRVSIGSAPSCNSPTTRASSTFRR